MFLTSFLKSVVVYVVFCLFVCLFFLFEIESNYRSCCTLIGEASYVKPVTHYAILNADRRDRRIKSPSVSPA